MSGFKLNLADLQFVLHQIKVAEANAAGIPLTSIVLDANGAVVGNPAAINPATNQTYYVTGPQGLLVPRDPTLPLAIPDPHVPVGLRTVDGTYNNIVPGRETWGAADQAMPRLLDPNYTTGSGTFDTNGPAPNGEVTGGNYSNTGTIVDTAPRTVSNLIVDVSLNNPAAIIAALTFAGSTDVLADQAAITAAWEALKAARDANPAGNHSVLETALNTVLNAKGVTVTNGSIDVPNVAPDEGLSAPFNAWMTFFGQFFDHGLDLISKGGNGTVFVPLAADDPLVTHGPDGVKNTGDEVPAAMRFMALTRATPDDGSQTNTTTPFVDQNQTYTSHASHQVFLREYTMVGGKPVATGKLLGGDTGGLATWADVKEQARDKLGIVLSDLDVLNVPLLRTDAYGEFIRGTNGFPLVITGLGVDGIPNTADDAVAGGTNLAPLNLATLNGGLGPVRTSHAFLDDIAHNAAPAVGLAADSDTLTGNAVAINPQTGQRLAYDNELLDRHYITGDGRGNENIGLTTVHHIFHSEHNRQVDSQKLTILQSGDITFVNEWFSTDISQSALDGFLAGYNAATNKATYLAGAGSSVFNNAGWDGERLFQAARFATEMQYQHLVFEEFARKVQPAIDVFVFNAVTDINPAIFSEFANTVYRFGHSMLTENMPRIDGNGVAMDNDLGLVESFLNPVLFDNNGAITHDAGAAAIVRGMTIERGAEIDEFVVDALRNNLLGLPLDLAALNIARGRDTGMPSLNDARTQLYAASGSTFLKPYTSWADLAANLKNPASIVNFIAAYGTHASITGATTLDGKRDAAMALVFGGTGAPADRLDFLNGRDHLGGTNWSTAETGLNTIDLWIGGLAEKKMPFGGMLGSTFNAIFELQLENLQDADRFYYLTRTQGQNFLTMLEQNSFAKMIMANTDLAQPGADGIRGTADDEVARHIGVDSFATYDYVLEVNAANQADYDPTNASLSGKDPTGTDPFLEAMGLGKVVRDDLGTPGVDLNFLRFVGGEHVVVGGTNGEDTIITDFGDDGIWGDAGNDRIESGAGVDLVNGGAGDDIITDSGDTGDFLKGDEGDDVIANSNGVDILMGGTGKDVVFVGVDSTEVFGGEGDDFIAGGDGVDFLLGGEGNDWMEAGGGFDTTAGDNSELFFNSAIKGHDVMFAGSEEHDFDAESGDDIMVQGESVIRNEGMFGFDWAIYKGVSIAANADLRVPIFTTEQADILRNRFDKTEALSGWDKNDVLRGDDRVADAPGGAAITAANEGVFFNDELTQAGVDRITGLRNMLGNLITAAAAGDREAQVAFNAGNILLGGGGSDLLQGNGGDDYIDGDNWLNVRIRISSATNPNGQIATIDSLRHVFTAQDAADPSWVGKSLFELLLDRTIVPNQLHIVREIVKDDGVGDTDVAVFNDVRANYTIITNPNGTFTVRHDTLTAGAIDPVTGKALVSDGTDTLRNVEKARFADGVEVTFSLPVAATGAPVISDTTPTEGQQLTAQTGTIADANGLGTFSYQWQQSTNGTTWTNIPGATAQTFTPQDLALTAAGAQLGQQLRVVVSFTDGGGTVETLVSAATAPTGADWDGIVAVNNTFNGTAGNDIADGGDRIVVGGNDTLNGNAGDDILNGRGGNDTVRGGTGNDLLQYNVTTNIFGLSSGRDLIDGGTTGAGSIDTSSDTFALTGTGAAETFRIYTRQAWQQAGNNLNQLNGATEIVVTRNGTNNAAIIAELDNIEEIVINGVTASPPGGPVNTATGGDTIQVFGNFAQTSLALNTITINGGAGNDTVDFSALSSAHRIVFRSNGGNDTIVGTIRPQDVVELPSGQDISSYALTNNGNGTSTLSNGTHSVTFAGTVPPQLQNASPPPANGDGVSGAFEYTPSDLAGLKALINGQQPDNGDDGLPTGVRELSGHGNNVANPNWGSADQPFIRITDAHYGAPDANGNLAVNPVFAGLDPRTISNVLGAQEAGLPLAGNNANIFFMAMGQYIDHGLDFLGKGGNGSIQIGAPGGGAPGSGNPADLTRGSVAGYADGVPQHINRTSPYIDQNQAYGSNDLVGQFLREADGNGGIGAHLFAGAPDPSNPSFSLLPTLRELIEQHWENNTVLHSASLPGGSVAFQSYFAGLVDANGVINAAMLPTMISNFMGTNHALLLDANPFINVLDHYIAGDGRANENFALTSIHTIWARNHNYHVEGLEAAGFQGTAEELFQAAKMINEAEYQRVVFDEYLDTLLGGLRSEGTHGFKEYDPTANAGISHEFAGAVFRFGHSLIGQTMTVLDAYGNPTQVNLFDAFLNPSNDPSVFGAPLPPGYTPQPGYAQHGVNAIIGGTISQPSEDVDFNIVDAVRNDLVRINADLFAFNVARGWDLGIGTLNQVRRDLAASDNPYVAEAVGFAGGNLTPYSSWEDFQQRNGLSDAVIAQFRQAYPDLVLAAADIAAFQVINPDIAIAMQSNGTGIVSGIDRLDLWVGGLAERHINNGLVGETFWVVLSEQFERLQDGDRFYYIDRLDNFDFYENFIDGQQFADVIARNTGITTLPERVFETDPVDDGDGASNGGDTGGTTDPGTGGGTTDPGTDNGGVDNEDEEDEEDEVEEDVDQNDDDIDDDEVDEDDGSVDDPDDDSPVVVPPAGSNIMGTAGDDMLVGTSNGDLIFGMAGSDAIIAGGAADIIKAGAGEDFIDAGDGRDVIFAGADNDEVFAGGDDDLVYGDDGNDRIFAGDGNDMVTAGKGNDTVFGDAGNDTFVAEIGDGDDVYHGDGQNGGTGIDTLDLSAATAAVTVNLGTGLMAHGSASSSQTGNDTLWGIENAVTGSGADTIIASSAVNVMDGGAGADVFRFHTTEDADGDTIVGFEPGDRLDFTNIDANLGAAGDQAFQLVNGNSSNAAAQLVVLHETRADGDYTVVEGHVNGDGNADFQLNIKGHHTLTSGDFSL